MHIPEISIYPEVHKIESCQQQSSLTRDQKFLSRILLKSKTSNRVLIEVPLATLLRIGVSWYGVHSYRYLGRSIRIFRCLDRSLHRFWYQVDLSIFLGIRVDRFIVCGVQVDLTIFSGVQDNYYTFLCLGWWLHSFWCPSRSLHSFKRSGQSLHSCWCPGRFLYCLKRPGRSLHSFWSAARFLHIFQCLSRSLHSYILASRSIPA